MSPRFYEYTTLPSIGSCSPGVYCATWSHGHLAFKCQLLFSGDPYVEQHDPTGKKARGSTMNVLVAALAVTNLLVLRLPRLREYSNLREVSRRLQDLGSPEGSTLL